MKSRVFFLWVLFILNACTNDPFLEPLVLAGREVSAESLNRGYKVYQKNCLSCHGEKGDGMGITYQALKTRPRNLTQGLYKFGLGPEGSLPSDKDFKKILDHGLAGTAMLPWGLTDQQSEDVIQYIKTFALGVWGKEAYVAPKKLAFSKDPYKGAYLKYAQKRGEQIYHQNAQCFSCHKAYLSIPEMKEITGESQLTEKSEIFQVKPQETMYYSGSNSKDFLMSNPPDFKTNNIRSAHSVEEIYQRISVGVGGTTMPGWNSSLSEDELWALAYYVQSLVDQRIEYE